MRKSGVWELGPLPATDEDGQRKDGDGFHVHAPQDFVWVFPVARLSQHQIMLTWF